ncbi:unnamed protein product [Symbiodinium sp. CCMP2456]|nr:unnamed protein product [Symbiodinium sp. CCMP2456]
MEDGEHGDTWPQGDGSSLSEGPEDSISNVPDANPFIESWIQVLMQMRITRPQVQRGLPVYRALQQVPRKWARKELDKIHALTRTTSQFHEFWSHSWRTKAWLKYINILFLNNSFPAFVMGTILALAAFFLSFTGLLPVWAGSNTGYIWCTPAGIFGYYLTLLLWRSRKLAFLDIACINQQDALMKAEALVSMGAFLKESQSFLVFWDASYVTSLLSFPRSICFTTRCTFVLFVERVRVRSLASRLFQAVLKAALARGCGASSSSERFFTAKGPRPSLRSAFRSARFLSARLFWPVILASVCSGSTEKFESMVRGQVLQVLVHQLANHVFSYWRIVQITAPAGWAILDVWCDNFKRGSISVDKVPGIPTPLEVLNMVYSIIFFNFMLLPIMALILLRLAYAARHVGERRCMQILLSLGLVKVGGLLAGVCVVLEQITADLLGGREESPVYAIVILSAMGLLTLFFWRCPAIVSVPLVSRRVGHCSDISP